MRLTALATVLLAVGASGAFAQDTSPQALELPVHGRPAAEAVTAPVQMERPADVVAQLAREALYGPGSGESMKALASALPELALTGGADIESTFAAARVADSLAVTAPITNSVAADASTAGRSDLWSWVPALGVSDDWLRLIQTPEVVGSLAALLLAAILIGRALGRRRAAPPKRAPNVAKPRGRLWTARTLASGGAHVSEIAERTGMAQEAVHLALRLAGVGAVQSWDEQLPHRQPARVSPRAVDLELERDVIAGSRHLRDRVLTYGGAAR